MDFVKDPDAELDFAIDWSEWLPHGDAIASSQWIADGLTIERDSHTASKTTVWISGGENRRRYKATNRITTAGGRVDDRTIILRIAHQ